MSNIKRLFFDIETSYNIGSFWSLGKQYMSYPNIIKERAIICICYKWENDKKVHYLTWDNNQCDKKMLESFIKVLNQADEIVGQNHENFDIKWLRTRCLLHAIPMFPTYSTLDTYKKAKTGFRFNSNSLDYIAKYLNMGEKIKMNIKDWDAIILRKDKKALDKMVRYCKKDVVLLENVYKKLSPYITSNFHHGVALGKPKFSCPKCTSIAYKYSKTRYTATGLTRHQVQCGDCHSYYTLSDKTYNDREK